MIDFLQIDAGTGVVGAGPRKRRGGGRWGTLGTLRGSCWVPWGGQRDSMCTESPGARERGLDIGTHKTQKVIGLKLQKVITESYGSYGK